MINLLSNLMKVCGISNVVHTYKICDMKCSHNGYISYWHTSLIFMYKYALPAV